MKFREIILGIAEEAKQSIYLDDMIRTILKGLVTSGVIPGECYDRGIASDLARLLKSDLFIFVLQKCLKEGPMVSNGRTPSGIWSGNIDVSGMATSPEPDTVGAGKA